MPTSNPRITPTKTMADWRAFSLQLVPGGTPDLWQVAASDYFHERLRSRYLTPIAVLENGKFEGEGFSIVAIQCTLIEFLESTCQGKNYNHQYDNLNPTEYKNSSAMFVSFLTTRSPFSGDFDERLAKSFYRGVRCGILHEAQTKEGWIIKSLPSTMIVDKLHKVVFRWRFQEALFEFIERYEKQLVSDVALQEAFIRKFDYICM